MPRSIVLFAISVLVSCARESAEGETCSKTADCKDGLACIDQRCVASAKSGGSENERQSTARNEVVTIQGAAEQYRITKRGKCPTSLQDLKAAGFINKIGKDPWGNDYDFKCPGEKMTVDVVSGGPDGKLGTDDDIANYD